MWAVDPEFVVTDWEMPSRSREHPSRRRTIVSQLCPNCDARFPTTARTDVYCGMQCQDEAKAVRYGRATLRQYGRQPPNDVVEALRIKIAHALGGGYDRPARRISPARRAEVWQRDDDQCVKCGAPGEEIDHIDGSSDDLANLRLLCRTCHKQITSTHMKPVTDPAMRRRATWLRQRVHSVDPLRPCDAADWRRLWREWIETHAGYANGE